MRTSSTQKPVEHVSVLRGAIAGVVGLAKAEGGS